MPQITKADVRHPSFYAYKKANYPHGVCPGNYIIMHIIVCSTNLC